MKPAAVVVLLIFSLLLSFVAARLLGLAARTRRTPELLLGLSMALPVAGYTFGFLCAAASHGIPPKWASEAAGAFCDLGFIATVGFVWRVFRQKERWAAALSLFITLGFAAMPFVNHFVSWDGGVPAALVPRSMLRTLCYGWAAVESLHYARLMRRRVRFGLAEPLVADRFSLWGFYHVCFALMLLLVMAGVRLHFSGADFARFCTFAGISCGLFASVPLMLSFFPPDRYARYVEQRYRREEAV